MEPGLEETAVYDPPNFSWPGGAHAAVVEVDTETGDARLVRYVAVDDCGTVVNPLIVDGQIHGGVTQGIATALYEEGLYDDEGNLMTTNMTTYLVPSAAELPSFELGRTETTEPDQSARRQGRGRDRHDRRRAGGGERGYRRALRISASRTSGCRRRRSESGMRSRRQGDDPRVVRLRRRRERRPRARTARQRRCEAPRRRPLAHSGAQAPDRPPRASGRHRPPGRSLLRARCRCRDRDRRPHLPHVGCERAAPSGALPDRQPHSGAHRRSAGSPSRHDRWLARTRRPGI